MVSSSDSGGGGPIASSAGPPIPGLPVAGKDSSIGSPYEYGKFQNFLPDLNPSGPNPMATGLRPDMFQYKSPSGVVAQGDTGNQIQALRDQLAQLQNSQQSQQNTPGSGPPTTSPGWGMPPGVGGESGGNSGAP